MSLAIINRLNNYNQINLIDLVLIGHLAEFHLKFSKKVHA